MEDTYAHSGYIKAVYTNVDDVTTLLKMIEKYISNLNDIYKFLTHYIYKEKNQKIDNSIFNFEYYTTLKKAKDLKDLFQRLSTNNDLNNDNIEHINFEISKSLSMYYEIMLQLHKIERIDIQYQEYIKDIMDEKSFEEKIIKPFEKQIADLEAKLEKENLELKKKEFERNIPMFEKNITYLLDKFNTNHKLDNDNFEKLFKEIKKTELNSIQNLRKLGVSTSLQLKIFTLYFTTLFDDLCFASLLQYNSNYDSVEKKEENIFIWEEKNLKERCKDKKYMFFRIRLPSHANMAFIDLQNNTIEYFEPNDDFKEEFIIYKQGVIYSREILVKEIQKYLYTELGKEFEYIKIKYYKLFTGNFQFYDSLLETSNLGPKGYCSVWIFYYLNTKMLNPDLSLSDIILKYNLNKYKDNETNFEDKDLLFKPESFMDIRIYGLFIIFTSELFEQIIEKVYDEDSLQRVYDSFVKKIKEKKKVIIIICIIII